MDIRQSPGPCRDPATHLRPETADPRKTETWAWSKAETERRRHAAATRPTLAPIDAFPDEYATGDDLAAVRLDADPDATGPYSRTIRGLLGCACAGWRVRSTSVELYDALRADDPTNRQRSIATVLINEASFEDLVNAHTEGAFTCGSSPERPSARAPYHHCGFARSTPSRRLLRARTTHGEPDAFRT